MARRTRQRQAAADQRQRCLGGGRPFLAALAGFTVAGILVAVSSPLGTPALSLQSSTPERQLEQSSPKELAVQGALAMPELGQTAQVPPPPAPAAAQVLPPAAPSTTQVPPAAAPAVAQAPPAAAPAEAQAPPVDAPAEAQANLTAVPAAAQVSLRPRSTDFPIDLVVAAFSEDVSWVEPMLSRVKPGAELRLYCKGPRIKDERCLRIENYGGEEYAYLTHIVHFYDSLAPITIFTLGSIYNSDWNMLKCRKLNFVLSQVDTPEKRDNFSGFVTMAHQAPDSFMEFEGYFELKSYRNHAGGQNTPACRASVKPLDKWFQEFIVGVPIKHARHTGVLYNPIFAVSKERIHRFPKAMYERLLGEILRCTEKINEGVAEAGHYLERSWKPMFEQHIPAAFKCAGHFGQKKGDPMCCKHPPGKTIELPWTICKAERPTCIGLVDGSSWGTCMPLGLGPREDHCPDEVVRRAPKPKSK